MPEASPIHAAEGGVHLRVKAVPGACRDQVAGLLGDALKVRISAPPEGGKANKAIAALLAKTMGVAPRDVELVSGQTQPRKIWLIRGVDAATARQRLADAL